MKQKYTVKEYDTIMCNEKYKDDDRYVYMEEDVFNKLSIFIDEFTKNEEDADVLDFLRKGYRRDVKNTITFKNYVGLIQMNNGVQIEILPKIDLTSNEGDSDTKTKKIFLDMLRCLKEFQEKYSYTFKFINSKNERVKFLILGDSQVSKEYINNLFKNRFGTSVIVDYKDYNCKGVDAQIIGNQYDCIFVGPTPHSVKGKGDDTSLLSALQRNNQYIERVGERELKISISTLNKAISRYLNKVGGLKTC